MESKSTCFQESQINPAKKKRRRLKQALKDIQQQVEFYFSDSNLHQDKFLLQKTGKQGLNYVPIDLLRDFNCLKELEATSDMIVKAVQNSPMLELDIKKKSIRRKHSLLPASNTDPRTIYIESLPDDTTIKWLKDVTSKLGEVQYISLPRYKNSGLVKGYAFIEFARVEEAQRACTILNAPPVNFFPNRLSKPPASELNEMNAIENNMKIDETSNKKQIFNDMPPPNKRLKFNKVGIETNDLHNNSNHTAYIEERRIGVKFPSKQTADNINHSLNNLGYNTGNSNDNCHLNNNPSGKYVENLKKSKSNNLNSLPISNSQQYIDSNNILQNDIDALISMSRKAIAKPKGNVNNAKPQVLSAVVDVTKKKKTRKRSRKQNAALKINWKQPAPKLTVMLKTTWNEAKKLYLREQRTSLGNLKSIMHKNVHPESGAATVFIKRHAALNAQSGDDEIMGVNSEDVPGEKIETKNQVSTHCPPSFKPGVIVKINNIFPDVQIDYSANKPITFKCLKTHFSNYGEVAYVDISSGNNEGFIRYKDSAFAQKAILEEQKYNLQLLTGEMEERYWDSLLVSRQLKRSRERKRVRGRDKLVARAEQILSKSSSKHIKFNSDFP